MEFLERLADYLGDDRWLVDVNGTLRIAWFIGGDGDNPDWLARTEVATRAFHGPIHPRLATLHRGTLYGDRLLLEVDDDRGPTLADAAAQLADPSERERWVVSQIIGIADGIAAVQARGSYIAPLDDERIFIDVAAHARLRAPLVHAPRPRSTRAGPGPGYFTAPFQSPEQAMTLPVGPASNVFSLATNLYLAITGERPFAADGNMMGELVNIIQAEPAPVELVTSGLATVLARAFVKDPIRRIPDVAAFAAALREVVPDAADVDTVISDRIVPWRATVPLGSNIFEDVSCQQRWDALAPTSDELRRCAKCAVFVVRVRSRDAPVPLHGWSCRPGA